MHLHAPVAARIAVAALLITAATSLFAQKQPDISITARVRARELLFYEVPNVSVTFLLPDWNSTVWDTQRQNLPERVQPNVVYRDIGVNLTITSTLPDIEQILNDALGPTSSKESMDENSRSDTGSSDDGSDGDGAATDDADTNTSTTTSKTPPRRNPR